MSRLEDGQTLTDSFNQQYRCNRSSVMQEMERVVCGCDYGGTSWATRTEAEHVGTLLELGPSKKLLEVGSGSGWPALYLVRTTGCQAVLVDVPQDAIRIAAERARSERLTHLCTFAVADGGSLPFPEGAFDSVSHSDVLCCLEPKSDVLRACRRVVPKGGRMVFSVISIVPDLSRSDFDRAVEAGPPFVAAEASYVELLERTGWGVEQSFDLTNEWRATHRRLLQQQEARAKDLNELLGAAEHAQRVTGNRAAIEAIDSGLLRRELLVANAV